MTKLLHSKEIYIDTNIIFRALGINGESLKSVMIAFLKKCCQARIKVKISRFTKNEFDNTIDHYISKIAE